MNARMPRQNAFIFHGTEGNPEGNWFPWLKTQLEDLNIHTRIPRLPTPDGQSVENWMATIEPYIPDMGAGTLLIGHSSGANFILHLLERLSAPVAYAGLVGTIMQETDLPWINSLNTTFFEHDFDWPKIRSNALRFSIFHSDNDPYTPFPHADKVSKGLNVPVHLIPGGGHLNAEWGFTTFFPLRDDILAFLEKSRALTA